MILINSQIPQIKVLINPHDFTYSHPKYLIVTYFLTWVSCTFTTTHSKSSKSPYTFTISHTGQLENLDNNPNVPAHTTRTLNS